MTRRQVLHGLAGAAALIAGITVLSRLLGFGRWLAHAYAVGPTATGDAYATANLVPNVLFEVVAGGALAGAVVPLLAGPLARGMRAEVDRTASALLTWALLVLLPASVLLALLARPVVGLLLGASPSGQDSAATAATVDLASHLLVVFAPQVVLYGVGVVLTGVLQAQQRFLWPAAAPVASSLVVIASYLVFRFLTAGEPGDPAALSSAAVAWLAWGTTAGVAAMSLPLLVPVARSGVRLRPTWRFPPGVARRARHLALAGLGGLLAQQLSVVVVLRLSNEFGSTGTFPLYQYSQAVYFLPYAVLAVPLATAAFPRLAEHVASGDHSRYAGLVALSTRAVLVVSAAGAAALAAVAPAVAGVFAVVVPGGDAASVSAMTPALTLLAPGLLGYALIFQLSRVLYALERGRAAVIAIATGWGAVAVASLVAVPLLAPERGDGLATLQGLALGNTVGMLVAGLALLVAVRRVSGPDALSGLMRTLVVSAVGGGVGALAGRWLVEWLAGPPLVLGMIGAAVAAGTALAATGLADRQTVRGALRDRGRAARTTGGQG
ncbi:murein biosynthesis integral membrane protein MurJ [Actinotalea sp. C106]|uniref:murein biosynthesis integral membrane protein MurJ n=1 Tax=Actinotalea sp. C106 TaxID=2908644 RepID=UPI0020289699|nr:lipid II flippase MurJ [Actinotalea sp. C106]